MAESRAKRFSQTKPVKVSSGQLTNGTTGNGGTFGFGTVFELAPDETETILHSFGGPPSDGSYGGGPTLLRDSSGNLYGSTYYGGAYDGNEQGSGYGTVFKVSASGVESVLLNFNGHGGGGYPLDGLAGGGSGNFYGTTGSGGSASCSEYPTGCGVLFRLNSNGRERCCTSLASRPPTEGSPTRA
ncbi:MAG TPA: choice-of-anchor tandem repeat GloVer-containing protein [Terriglobia bacterium]|nr:choice-of-anchor tandem repeat GloVer-containing protein [Terriglobia bacterium]